MTEPRVCPECGHYDCVFDAIEQAFAEHKDGELE
jgi:hypothetical protein